MVQDLSWSKEISLPPRSSLFPSGRSLFPSGRSLFPSLFLPGDLSFLPGRSLFPSGRSLFPSGQISLSFRPISSAMGARSPCAFMFAVLTRSCSRAADDGRSRRTRARSGLPRCAAGRHGGHRRRMLIISLTYGSRRKSRLCTNAMSAPVQRPALPDRGRAGPLRRPAPPARAAAGCRAQRVPAAADGRGGGARERRGGLSAGAGRAGPPVRAPASGVCASGSERGLREPQASGSGELALLARPCPWWSSKNTQKCVFIFPRKF